MPETTSKIVDTRVPLLSRISRFLSDDGRMKLVKLSSECLRAPGHIHLPFDVHNAKRVAVVLPESPFDAFYQIGTVHSLVTLFHGVTIVLVCERHIAGFFEHIAGITEIATYDRASRYLYSKELQTVVSMIAENPFDICILLERKPDISLLHLITQLSPGIRIGYDDAGEFPFLNIRVRTQNSGMYITDKNFLLAKVLGAKMPGAMRWSVSKQSKEEIRHSIREYRIADNACLAGIDIECFFRLFGEQWTAILVDELTKLTSFSWYFFCESMPDQRLADWLASKRLPVFSALLPSRSAALIHQSSLLVSGRGLLFALANVLARTVIGVFAAAESSTYCTPVAWCREVTYERKPDETTIRRILEIVVHHAASLTAPV